MLKGIIVFVAIVSFSTVCGQQNQGSECEPECPLRSGRDTNSCECRCYTTNSAPVNGHCPCGYIPRCPAGSRYDSKQCQCLCRNGQPPVNNTCVSECELECPARSGREANSCDCRCFTTNGAPVNGHCPCGYIPRCPAAATYDLKNCQCVCNNGEPPVNGTCPCDEACPTRSQRDTNACGCICYETNQAPLGGRCPCGFVMPCTGGAIFNPDTCQCQCRNGELRVNGTCQQRLLLGSSNCQQVCPPRSQQEFNSCDCVCYETNKAPVDGQCPCGYVSSCTGSAVFNAGSCQCECSNGDLPVNGTCENVALLSNNDNDGAGFLKASMVLVTLTLLATLWSRG